ncbi:MAG TPA: universal stress protein [Desulfomonilaceae bacterium]|nr:universal stress protein [Desulfomonilaceae bacterium]
MIPKKILLCVDFSRYSERASEVAADYAKNFGASLLVLNVVNTRFFSHPAIMDSPAYGRAFDEAQQIAQKKLMEVADNIKKKVPDLKSFSRTGVPGEEIIKLAAEQSVDLIIVGTMGRTGVSRLLLGSAAETVIKSASCDVLTVRA